MGYLSASRQDMEAKQPIIMNDMALTDKELWMTDTSRNVSKQLILSKSHMPTAKKSWMTDAHGAVVKQTVIYQPTTNRG